MEGNNKLELLGNAPIPKALMSLGIPIMIGMLIIGFSQLSVTEFFVFRKMESHETKNHLLCGWCSKCL